MLRKIVILFPALAFTLPLVATSSASAADPWQVGKHDQVWPDTPTYPDQWEPTQIDQLDQIKPIGPDCDLVEECPSAEECEWDMELCECYLVNPCTGETVVPEPLPLPDEFDL